MLFRKKVVLAKIESTYGTDPTPDGSNAILTKNLEIQPLQGNRVTRGLDRATLGNDQEIPTSFYTGVTFEVELAGAGTAGDVPGYGVLLRGCGFNEVISVGVDVQYNLISDAFESIAMYYYHDGQYFKVLGSRGSVSFALNKDQLPVMRYSFMGLHTPVAALAMVTPDHSEFIQPIAVTADNTPTYTVDSYAASAEAFSADIANNVVYRNVVNSEAVKITDRAPAGTLNFEEPAIGTKDFYAICEAATLVPIQIVHGVTAGNIVQIDAPKVQLSQPSKADSDGISVLQTNTLFVPNAGDDEFKLTVK
ncbi:hypothetical protein HBA55_34850 [Pseudomaricurvus alkylphenolicus]|uniref:phage tail tube protein n=1 Tax=Pseudomaricurvus alkylphenolicus TaxID=1306991 RepID=UPI00141DE505|nr:phage tail tube protein [Pseudomaricurvus alkylphenolicus]NIB44812.1 hypothetical protein [Pseudomaricurvus alkylphenolicus]